MANSSEISPEDGIVYTQYNDLRDDVLSPTTGHTHTGEADDGQRIHSVNRLNVGSGVSGAADGQILFSDFIKRTGDNAYAVMATQGELQVRAVTYTKSWSNVDAGDYRDMSEQVSYGITFTTVYAVQVTIEEVTSNISYISRVRVSDVTTSAVRVKCRMYSAASGQTQTVKAHVLVIGV